MRTVLDMVPVAGDRLDEANKAVLADRIAQAYGALFSGTGGTDDACLVLIDLAQFARYYDTASLTMPVEQIAALAQRRAMFQRIMDAMTSAGAEPVGLHTAVIRTPEVTEIYEETT